MDIKDAFELIGKYGIIPFVAIYFVLQYVRLTNALIERIDSKLDKIIALQYQILTKERGDKP